MTTCGNAAILSAALLLAATIAAGAQPQYQPYGYAYPYNQAPAAQQPLSSYDPYLSGATTCPQGGAKAWAKCDVLIPPNYPSAPTR